MFGKSFKQAIGHLAILRVYSWINTISLGVIAVLLSGSGNFFGAIVLSLLLWFVVNFVSEFFQKDAGRVQPNKFTLLLLAGLMLLFLNNVFALLSGVIFLLMSIGYAQKKRKSIGVFSFIFRGVQEAFIFLTVLFYAGGSLSSLSILFAFFVFAFIGARSLIGDLRDFKTDLTTLPVRTSIFFSQVVSLVLLCISCIFSFLFLPNLLLIIPIILVIVLLFLYNLLKLHRAVLILTTAYFVFVIMLLTADWLWGVVILADVVVVKLTYKSVYRKINIHL